MGPTIEFDLMYLLLNVIAIRIGSTISWEFSWLWNLDSDWLRNLTGIQVVEKHIWNLIGYIR